MMELNVIHNKDCVIGMQELDEASIDLVVTSPPYNLNINYGEYNDDLPREEYLNWLGTVFTQVKRILKNNGHFFLNVGYTNIDPWVGMDVANIARSHFVLQNNFVWTKSIFVDGKTHGHFKPINSDRFANPTWEHLYHFSKNGDAPCNKLAVGVPYEWECNTDNSGRIRGRLVKKMGFTNWRDFEKNASEEQKNILQRELTQKITNLPEKPKVHCRGNTWFVPYDTISDRHKHRGKHPATYPVALVDNCIKFSGITEGVVLDPFMGSGTTALAAVANGLSYIGYEVDQEYIDFAEDRIAYDSTALLDKFIETD